MDYIFSFVIEYKLVKVYGKRLVVVMMLVMGMMMLRLKFWHCFCEVYVWGCICMDVKYVYDMYMDIYKCGRAGI